MSIPLHALIDSGCGARHAEATARCSDGEAWRLIGTYCSSVYWEKNLTIVNVVTVVLHTDSKEAPENVWMLGLLCIRPIRRFTASQ